VKNRWIFLAAAAIPCVLLLVFCGVGIREWWLISSQQIVVIPGAMRGGTTPPGLPASALVPLILGSGALAAMFAYALLRGSRRALYCAYLVLCLVIAAPYIWRML
jgi:hypothetical protein